MPDIKFRCPECAQKIAVDSSAAGVRIDCPSCKSTLVIPAAVDAAVEVIQRRKLAIVGGSADALYEQITARQKELDDAVAESRRLRDEAEKLRAESEKAREEGNASRLEKERIAAEVEKLRSDLGAAISECDGLKKRESELLFQASVEADAEKQFQKLSVDLAEALRERDELSSKLAAVDSLREALAKAEQERESFRGETELLKIELKAAVANSGAAASQWDDNRKAMDRLREQLDGVTTERDSLRLNADKAVGEVGFLRSEVERLKADFTKDGARLAELVAKCETLTRERDQLRDSALTGEEAQREVAVAREEVAAARSEADTLTRALEAAKLDLDQAKSISAERERATEKMSAAMEAARTEIAALQKEMASVTQERERIATSSDELKEETKELQQRVDGLLEELHAAQRDLAAAKQEAVTIKQGMETRDADFRGATERLNELTAKYAVRDTEANDALSRLEAARGIAQDAQSRFEHAERAAAAANEKVRIAEEERFRVAEQLAKVTTDLGSCQEQLKQARVEKEQNRSLYIGLQAEMERHLDSVHSVDSERDSLRAELEAVKAGLERAKQHVSVLQARRETMREEINSLRAKLGLPPETLGA